MIYIGIDPSYSASGIVAFEDNKPIFMGELAGKITKDKKYVEMAISNLYPGKQYHISMKTTLEYGEYARIMMLHKLLYNVIYEIIHGGKLFTLCIENPMGSHIGAGGKIDRAYTAALFAIQTVMEKPFSKCVEKPKIVIVAPTHLKKVSTGKGNANKKMMVEAANRHLRDIVKTDFRIKSHNIADAYGLCLIAMQS